MGADTTIAGKNGTCLKVAENEGHFKLMEFLRDWESKQSSGKTKHATHLASITYNTKLLEAAEIMGIEAPIAIACLYQMQSRGEPTDDLQSLMEEVNKYKLQTRECTVCLNDTVNSLFLPCRHSATCMECAELVQKSSKICPICREQIAEVLQIFLS